MLSTVGEEGSQPSMLAVETARALLIHRAGKLPRGDLELNPLKTL